MNMKKKKKKNRHRKLRPNHWRLLFNVPCQIISLVLADKNVDTHIEWNRYHKPSYDKLFLVRRSLELGINYLRTMSLEFFLCERKNSKLTLRVVASKLESTTIKTTCTRSSIYLFDRKKTDFARRKFWVSSQ